MIPCTVKHATTSHAQSARSRRTDGRDARRSKRARTAYSAALFAARRAGAAGRSARPPLSMLWGGRLAFQTFGWHFICQRRLGPGHEAIRRASCRSTAPWSRSAIAMLIAVPVSFGIALFLTEIAPGWLRGADRRGRSSCWRASPRSSTACGACSSFVPFMSDYVEPWLNDHLGPLPVIGACFRGPPIGIGMLTAGIVLGIMVIPFISSVMREVFITVPAHAEGVRVRAGRHHLGGGLGRRAALHALGRGRRHLPGPGPRARRNHGGDVRARQCASADRIAAAAGQFDRRDHRQRVHRGRFRIYLSSLIALGFLLFVVTFIVLAIARLMLTTSRAGRALMQSPSASDPLAAPPVSTTDAAKVLGTAGDTVWPVLARLDSVDDR